jgi:DNA-directed RNA polymerase specialized sigma subunit
MALSDSAVAVRKELSAAVLWRRALTAAQNEWRQLAEHGEVLGEEMIWQLLREKREYQRQLAVAGLKNWVRLTHAGLSDRRRRLLRLRYVQGESWAAITALTGRSKQYLMREHNRALEQIAHGERRERS